MVSYNKILLCYDGMFEGCKVLCCGVNFVMDLKVEMYLLLVVDMCLSIV